MTARPVRIDEADGLAPWWPGIPACKRSPADQPQIQPPAKSQPAQDIPDAPSTVQPPAPKPAFHRRDAPAAAKPFPGDMPATPPQLSGSRRAEPAIRLPCLRSRPAPPGARPEKSDRSQGGSLYDFGLGQLRADSCDGQGRRWTPRRRPASQGLHGTGERQETEPDLLHQRSLSALSGDRARYRHGGCALQKVNQTYRPS